MGAIDFEAVLSGVARAGDDDGLAFVAIGHIKRLGCIELQFLTGQSQHFFYDSLGLGALYGELTVVVALVLEVDVETGHLLLHPRHVLVDIGGVDDEEEVVVGHLIDEEVIDGAAVGIAHHAIIDLSHGCISHVVGEDVLNVALGIGSCDTHFAHVADIKDTTMLAHRVVLVGDVRVLNGHDESAER